MSKKTSVLIIDNSPEFTGLLRDVLKQIPNIEILDDAGDGVEGLYHILRFKPDVVLLDLEMPKMDGMATLQHIMIHRPTPTIVLSELSGVTSSKSFDVLKNGAVDFFEKRFFTDQDDVSHTRDNLETKIMAAALMKVPMRKAFSLAQIKDLSPKQAQEKVIFCEDCGNRMVVSAVEEKHGLNCDRCGDTLILGAGVGNSPSSLSVLVGDDGAFYNILNIIPEIENCPTAAIICILDVPQQDLEAFTTYLASVSHLSVIRGSIGTAIEAGNCYLFTKSEHLCLKPYASTLKLQNIPQLSQEIDPVDLMFASIAKIFRNHSLAILLSAQKDAPARGIDQMRKNGASVFSVDPKLCQYTQGMASVTKKISKRKLQDKEIVYEIESLGEDIMEVG